MRSVRLPRRTVPAVARLTVYLPEELHANAQVKAQQRTGCLAPVTSDVGEPRALAGHSPDVRITRL